MHLVIQSSEQLRQHNDEQGTQAANVNDATPARLEAAIQKGFADYEPLLADDEDKQNFSAVKSAMTAYLSAAAQARVKGTPENTKAMRAAHAALTQVTDKWWGYNQKLSKAYAADSKAAYHQGLSWIAGFMALALVAGLVVGLRLTRSLTSELGANPPMQPKSRKPLAQVGLTLRCESPPPTTDTASSQRWTGCGAS